VVEEKSQFLVSLTRLDILDGLADGSDAVLGLPTAAIVFKLLTMVVPVLGNTLVILLEVLHRGYTLHYFRGEVNRFFLIFFNPIMKLDRFVNQAVITTSCSPVWDVVALNIRVTTLGTFLLPTIFHFNLGVININQFHRGNTLSYPPRKVNSFFQNFRFFS